MSTNPNGLMTLQPAGDGVENMDTDSFARTPQMATNAARAGPVESTINTKIPRTDLPKPQQMEALQEQEPAKMSPAAVSVPEIPTTTDLDLLLIGKSGVGKSATGNSILGRKVFKSSASLNSVTDKISVDVAKVKGHIVKVVDGPGVGDTRMDTDAGIQLFVDSMEHAMVTNPLGYHAFLLVLRFGTRFTQEDVETIALLKKVFGDDFVKNYCVIVVTCGDMFKYEAEENDINFEQWWQQQTGAMAELVKECQNRIVLFDNITRKPEEKSAQLEELFKVIKTLNNNGKRYTDANFQTAFEAREKVIAESKVPLARDGTLEAITLLMQELGEIRGRGAESEDVETTQAIVNDLQRLLKNAAALKKDVLEQDKGTGALKDLIQSVETVEKSIASSLELHQLALRSRQEHMETESEMSSKVKELEEKIKNAKEEDERKRLMEENELFKRKMLDLERERDQARKMYEESQRNTYKEMDQCQSSFYSYQRQRESTIMDGLKIIFEVTVRPMKKLWKAVKREFLI